MKGAICLKTLSYSYVPEESLRAEAICPSCPIVSPAKRSVRTVSGSCPRMRGAQLRQASSKMIFNDLIATWFWGIGFKNSHILASSKMFVAAMEHLNTDIVNYVLLPLFIFLARIFDVSLGTLRIIFVTKG